MINRYLPLLVFLFLAFLTISSPFDFGTAVVPGWHTTVFPASYFWALAMSLLLLFVTIGYWILSRKAGAVSWWLFLIHFVLTVPAILFLSFPVLFLNVYYHYHQQNVLQQLDLFEQLTIAARALFVAGQIV